MKNHIGIQCKQLLDGFLDVHPQSIEFVRHNLATMKAKGTITDWREYEIPYVYFSRVDNPDSWNIADMGKLSNTRLE